ncbi:class I SAM-dependent methyltransferase [Serpentinicella alkaliphila]|uniref:Methyltransferase family protein n=1 Tax=Serpentinicella alkaliphila TaxID=1734049 RepID=A0A4R2T544_9FIRM|nr:methyltransferase domain-containing protein [Serpentinicella alkaliphila]QUH26174.1 methyltransferase domain-containing protein [Serpentinicella alkaliphila]TCP92198.1 methyltransferase family protein [Serpentinicella alkaliphila]
MSKKMKNYGMLLMDYFNGHIDAKQILKRDDGKLINIPIKIYFRDYDELMPSERNFFHYCKGEVLCIGGGTGVHSLILQEKGFDVLAIDISEEACEIMKRRGVKKVKCIDFYEFDEGQYETIVLLGRNIGMVGTLDNLESFLKHLKCFIKEDGQILLNSVDLKTACDQDDLKYMKMNEEAGRYYGEVKYRTIYDDREGDTFNWLYLDNVILKEYASSVGMDCEILEQDDAGNYLVRLTKHTHLDFV